MREAISRLWASLRGNAAVGRLEAELAHHLALSEAEGRGDGLDSIAARRRAALKLGGGDAIAERYRDQRGWPWLDDLFRDMRYGLRGLRRSPAFTAVALVTLALGIGANLAIFNLVNAVLLQPLRVKDPPRLVLLTNPNAGGHEFGTTSGRQNLLSYQEYLAIRRDGTAFRGLLAADVSVEKPEAVWAGKAGAELIQVKPVSGNYFDVLGVSAYRGRTFAPNEGRVTGADPVAVMSYAYWNQRFGRDPGVIGRQLQIYGHEFTVIGVAPPGFFGETVGQAPDLFVPISMAGWVLPGERNLLQDPPHGVSRAMWLQVMGRLKAGESLAAAQANANAVFSRLVQQQAGPATNAEQRRKILQQGLKLTSGAGGASSLRGDFGTPLVAVFALVGLVLVLAIVNLASLLLARAARRQKEVGIRMALGAGRGRIVRQLVTESMLLSLIGGGIGVGLAHWGDAVLLRMVGSGGEPLSAPGPGIPLQLHSDWRVLGFAAALCIGTGILFGLAPAVQMARLSVNSAVHTQRSGGIGAHHPRWQRLIRGGLPLGKILVIGQIAISVVLLVGAGLFMRSLQKLNDVPLGFNAKHLIEFGIDAGAAGYKGAAARSYFHHLQAALAAVPGVGAVALSMDGLFAGSEGGLPVAVDGYRAKDGTNTGGIRFDEVSGDYFRASGIPVVLGRGIDAADQTAGVKYAVFNQTAARQFFQNRNPLGRQIRDLYPDDKGVAYTVVGVVKDARYLNLNDTTPPRMYLPFFNGVPDGQITWAHTLVRTAGAVASVEAGLRRAIHATDPNVPIPTFKSLTLLVDVSLTRPLLLARLSGFFGLLGLLLAAMGLYGVLAYGVERRTPEIGIRMALGADRSQVMGMILRETAVVTAIGLSIGMPLSLAGAKLLGSQVQFFGLRYDDPATLAAAAMVLFGAALLAGYLPARRAARVHPMTALRTE